MSSPLFSMPVVAAALATGVFVSSASAQPIEGGIVLPAKLDREGLSQMLIPMRVSGHTFWCSADSGNNRVLSLDITKALNAGLQPNGVGTNAGVGPAVSRDQRIRGVDVEIGSVVLKDVTIVLDAKPTVVPDIDCVLGLGLLPEYAIEFDYLAPSVRLIPSARFRAAAAAVSVPIALDRVATPSTKVRLRIGEGTAEATLIVDTGASYYDVVLLKPFIDANHVADRVGTLVSRFSDAPGMTIGAARAPSISVGPFDVDGPVVALILTPSGGTYISDGLLGAGFLRRFKVTFDYSRQQLWLEPNGRTRGPQLFDASGIEVRPTADHEFAIVAVAADSAASVAGVRLRDVLKRVDGRPAREMTLGEIQAAFNRAGTTCTVQVEREGRLQTATLHLRRRL
jgi:PDZ domain-containing protein